MNTENTRSYEQTDRNTVHRIPKRAKYDCETIHRLFDQAWFCHVGFAGEFGPTNIPMFHTRIEDQIIFHGATTSRLMKYLANGEPVCLSVAMVDGLVLARSLFHHSLNYRSAVAFGRGELIVDPEARLRAFRAIADKIMPGRWNDARQPNELESRATSICAVRIESASAKIRTGGPLDDKDDLDLNVWAGVIPIQERIQSPIDDPNSKPKVPVPDYIKAFVDSNTLQFTRSNDVRLT
ncbi:MAG: pyridoxamine 5'-phosphate oxidase family protein [Planctomycetaceae bacterium]|nr:pyridoxamine 5'-phosphate oxidase family protein [Planctomycetaceae bacterium]